MKNLVLIAVGVVIGFAIAHQVDRTEAGHRLFQGVDARARRFGEAVEDGYRRREAELRAAVGEAEDTITELGKQ
jgi:hypothetical protein